ncbi:MAG TPA: hypothetical protein VLA97_10290 [Nocardioidaceae bacterium]|nr:hypothetical protein [Nocardioidaceae bacterium]
MIRRALAGVLLAFGLLVGIPASAAPSPVVAADFDCKESPTPDMPGQGLAGFFQKTPDPLPAQADPFAKGATTTIYEQYGFAGLRWHTYDLGCGPDAARNPDAIIGTAMSNWMLNLPISFTALTASITEVAFAPTFLHVFDPAISRISTALHDSLFATWVPAVIALLGIAILLKARRAAMATTAAAIGWALMVVLVATAIFKWPIAAGHFADDTVTSTLGTVVGEMNGPGSTRKPGTAVASNVHESIFYTSWLAGTLGSTDSDTARKYGPELFKAQALTWREAQIVQADPDRGEEIIEDKRDRFGEIADEIRESDPAAYEHLTGKRSDTRVGYAFLTTVGALLALPFLLIAALLLLGSFLIVRLAVMMFPAFATLGVFPAGRGLVLGIGRTVGAALVNAVIFGVGAAVTIRVLGVILDPASKLPGWLAVVLMPLFGFIMWVALKPFRRLTTMVSPRTDPFGDAAGAVGQASGDAKRWGKKAFSTAAAAYTGGVAAAVTADALEADDRTPPMPDRAEARPMPVEPVALAASPTAPSTPMHALPAAEAAASPDPTTRQAPYDPPPPPTSAPSSPSAPIPDGLPESPPPQHTSEEVPMPPTEPEWYDGEEVYTIYRPDEPGADDAA